MAMMAMTVTGQLRLAAGYVGYLQANVRVAAAGAANTAAADLVRRLKETSPRGEGASGPLGEGHLAESFHYVPATPASLRSQVTTTQPLKLRWVTEGTGIYGPLRRRIYPTTKKALFWPGADHPVQSIAGMAPRPFLDAVRAEVPMILETRLREVTAALLRRDLARIGLQESVGDIFGGAAGL